LIAGPCGTGKSHIAQALGHCAVRRGYDVIFTTQTQLVGQIHAARATGSIERKLQTLIRVPLLIIDDFGLKPLKPGQDEDFHDLIAERYETAVVKIYSNASGKRGLMNNAGVRPESCVSAKSVKGRPAKPRAWRR